MSTPAATSEQVRPAIELALRGLTQLHTGPRVVGRPGAPPRHRDSEIDRFTPLLDSPTGVDLAGRNLAAGLHHLAGVTNAVAALRHHAATRSTHSGHP